MIRATRSKEEPRDDVWSTADAKARLSEVIERARKGPQRIQSRGRDVAVVVSHDEMERLRAAARPTPMHAFLAVAEALRAEGAMTLEVPPRKRTRGRALPPLGT